MATKQYFIKGITNCGTFVETFVEFPSGNAKEIYRRELKRMTSKEDFKLGAHGFITLKAK